MILTKSQRQHIKLLQESIESECVEVNSTVETELDGFRNEEVNIHTLRALVNRQLIKSFDSHGSDFSISFIPKTIMSISL